jgi:hypothetical protein
MKNSAGLSIVLSLAAILALALAACSSPTNHAAPISPGLYSSSDLSGWLSNLEGALASSDPTDEKIVESIQSGLGAYVTAGRGSTPSTVTPQSLSYSSSFSDGTNSVSWPALSGLVLMPTAASLTKASVPLIAVQHGTQLYRSSAPSRFNPSLLLLRTSPDQSGAGENYVECVIAAYMATAGYIVVMPDYPGFGDDAGSHPYVHSSLGPVVRDAAKAAIALARGSAWKDTVSWNGQVFLFGYSEGGYATLVGARAAQADSSLGLTAAVPADGPYDLSGTMAQLIASKAPELYPYYAPYLFVGYHSIYGDSVYSYSSVFEGSYDMSLPPLFDGTHTAIDIAAVMTDQVPADYLTSQALAGLTSTTNAIYQTLMANDAYRAWTPTGRILFLHCPTDDVVPYANMTVAYQYLHALAPNNVEEQDIQPVDVADKAAEVHTRGLPNAALAALQYIDSLSRAR